MRVRNDLIQALNQLCTALTENKLYAYNLDHNIKMPSLIKKKFNANKVQRRYSGPVDSSNNTVSINHSDIRRVGQIEVSRSEE